MEGDWASGRVRPNQQEVSQHRATWGTRLVSAAATLLGCDLGGAGLDQDGSMRETDVLAESLPFDPAQLDRAIELYLDQIEDLGGALTDLMRSDGPAPWLLGVAIVSASSALAHRLSRKTRSRAVAPTDEEGSFSSWLLDPTSIGP